MTRNDIVQMAIFMIVLLLLVKPMGTYMARVFSPTPNRITRIGAPFEHLLYRLGGVHAEQEMSWKRYALAVMVFNVAGVLLLYALQRLQGWLPLNPQHFAAVPPDLAMNTAISFATNTNWQNYGGESTMSYLTDMLGLTVQNFVSAATGIAVLLALIRGFTRRNAQTLGNFWVDLTRATLYVLLPLALLLALALASQGVIQNLSAYVEAHPLQQLTAQTGDKSTLAKPGAAATQLLPMGPAASQVAIKQLGTNGGGYFNANSADPYENPTPLSNILEWLAMMLIPVSLCYTFGEMVRDRRQGWALLAAMMLILVPMMAVCVGAEQAGNPALHGLAVNQQASALQAGGNMEGKEVRFGIADSAIWTTAATGTSTGAVNSMLDSYTPLGGLVPLWLIQIGEVAPGGVGAGLYAMLAFAVIAVFIAGLMVGRTPEYLGKKIEAYDMKMAVLTVLIPSALLLVGTAIAVLTHAGVSSMDNPGAHGFSEVLYAFSSAANNNGSAFAGLNGNAPFYNMALGVCMFLGRYLPIIAVLALAGSLARKKLVPASAGTLPTHTPLFVSMLAGTVVLLGALTFLPALALGPIVESLIAAGH